MGAAPYHHGNLREALIEATIDLIEDKGVRGVSMRRLSERVDVSRSAAYRHFDDKEDLFAAVAREGFIRLHDAVHAVRVARDRYGTFGDRFRAMGEAYLRFAANNSPHYRLMFGQFEWNEEDHPELHTVCEQSYEELVQLIRTGQSDGIVREGDPEILAFGTWAYVHGLASLIIDDHAGPVEEDESTLRTVLSLLSVGVMNDPDSTMIQNIREG